LACYILGIALLTFSEIAASSKQIGFNDKWSLIFSLLVVMLTGTIALLKPENRGSRYRQA
jgi:hypothetical protein